MGGGGGASEEDDDSAEAPLARLDTHQSDRVMEVREPVRAEKAKRQQATQESSPANIVNNVCERPGAQECHARVPTHGME
jgi:hypothetical protein